MSRMSLASRIVLLHVLLLGLVLGLVWWSLQREAADYFMQLMKKYNIEPTEVHEMFLAANLRSLLGFGVTGAIVAALCAVFLTRRWLAPLGPMRDAAARIAAGDRAARTGVVGRDELGALARSFDAMAASLEQLDLSRQRLVVDAAHELRTPLTNLRGYLEALVDGVVPPSRESFELLHGECLRLCRLSESLLLAARNGEELAPRRERIDLAAFVAARVDAFRPRLAEQGLELRVDLGENGNVQADRDQLGSIVDNLLQNAVQFAPAGGSVSIRVLSKRGWQRLVVGNTGPGIPTEDLPHVFEPYFRGDPSRTRRFGPGGAGLGLAIVKACVEGHGGDVRISSSPGVTRVVVDLPADAEHADIMPKPVRSVAGSA